MSFTLGFWYYTGTKRASEPVLVKSKPELERVLADIVRQRAQPHPTQVVALELPTFGTANIPDRMFKMDLAPELSLGALHYFGPDPDDAHGQFGSWASVATEELGGTPPVLYIDKGNETPFPPGAAISLDVITKALDEFRLTGNRPTCVQWQRTGNIL